MFLVKDVLKIFSKFTGEHTCRSVISIKFLYNFIEITLRLGCSPVNLLHIFRAPFSKNTSGWLLLVNCYPHWPYEICESGKEVAFRVVDILIYPVSVFNKFTIISSSVVFIIEFKHERSEFNLNDWCYSLEFDTLAGKYWFEPMKKNIRIKLCVICPKLTTKATERCKLTFFC